MFIRYVLLCLLINNLTLLSAQNTVGLLSHNSQESYLGYNLVFPHNQSDVYLLDNCGEIVHLWEDDEIFRPGNSVYLLDDGKLVKCKRARTSAINDPIWAGGAGETVEIRTWDNALLRSFTLNDSLFRLHHDIVPLPNGNVLLIAWENKVFDEAVAAGRDVALMSQDKVWSEVILEWNPELNSIVWEWHAWDHLIQNYDNSKDNFGTPANHPERINLNYDNHDGHPDWLHINAIDYNPVLDQIVLSVPYFNELWVIDHSTTIAEAAGNSGGISGKGGNLLYRWGNPAAYSRGENTDQQLFFQHDVHWINPNAIEGDSDFGKIALYNNRLPGGSSTGNVIQTRPNGSYEIDSSTYLPLSFERTVLYPKQDIRAFSNSLSSAQFLPNGNALLLAGRWGFAYEITSENEVVWEYIIPLSAGRIASQGDTLNISNNITFRLQRYGLDYPAFENRDLSPRGYWELNPNEGFCGLVNTETATKEESDFQIYPNPTSNLLMIATERSKWITIYNLMGEKMQTIYLKNNFHQIDVSQWSKGIYLLVDEVGKVQKVAVQ